MTTATQKQFKETDIGLIPKKWGFDSLGNHCKILGGKRLPKEDSLVNQRTDHPYIRITDLGDFGVNESGLKYISDETHAKIKKYIIESGDIYISNVGTIGLVGLVKDNLSGANLTENVVRLTKLNGLNNLFLGYYLKSESGQNQIRQNTVGAVQPKLPIYGVANIKLPIPELTEQKEIAEILSSLDDKIELNRRINANLEKLASSLFKKWFVDIGDELPEGWSMESISNFGQVICGKTPSKSIKEYFGGDIPFIKIPDMHGNIFILKTEDSLSEAGMMSQKNKTIPAGSICVSCIATVGLVSMTTDNSQTNQQINSLIPAKSIYQLYLFHALKNLEGYLQRMGSSGSATLNVNTKSFSSIEIVKPSEEVLEKFDSLVRPIFDQIKRNAEESINLSVIRDSLLPRLMSGKIRV